MSAARIDTLTPHPLCPGQQPNRIRMSGVTGPAAGPFYTAEGRSLSGTDHEAPIQPPTFSVGHPSG